MRYSLLRGLGKAILQVIIFGWPFFLTHYSDVANLTIGAAGSILVNFLKVRYIIK